MEHLIPQHWFADLSQPILLLILAVAIGALAKGADWLVEGSSGMAFRLRIPKVIVGATIVSLGTTSPECAVSVVAAWSGQPELALGNAIGSIIVDTSLIFGIGCLMTVLPADRFVLNRQGWVQLGSAALLAALCFASFMIWGNAATLGRPVGVLMLALLAAYMVMSVRWSRQHPYGEPFQTPATADNKLPFLPSDRWRRTVWPVIALVSIALIGLLIVILSSRVLVLSVTELAGRWGVPQVIIAATLVAVGTSLPELVVGLAAILKGHKELLVGNIIGADVLNVLFVIGASAMAAELPITGGGGVLLFFHLPAMLVVLVLFRVFIQCSRRSGEFKRWYGVPLLIFYAAYVAGQFAITWA